MNQLRFSKSIGSNESPFMRPTGANESPEFSGPNGQCWSPLGQYHADRPIRLQQHNIPSPMGLALSTTKAHWSWPSGPALAHPLEPMGLPEGPPYVEALFSPMTQTHWVSCSPIVSTCLYSPTSEAHCDVHYNGPHQLGLFMSLTPLALGHVLWHFGTFGVNDLISV